MSVKTRMKEYSRVKRTMDIILSIFLGIIFLPIVLLTAVVIKVTSPGPVLADTPKRIGKGGKLFHLYKFRSMIVNAHRLLTANPKFKKLYSEYKRGGYKLYEDPRVTPLGHFIRKHSIDEIPQLLNVLRGEMSLVGPRPYYPDELTEQQKKYPQTRKLVKKVLSVKPGITGLWQVSGRSEVDFEKRITIDADYVDSMSFWLDLRIILLSPWAMISGRGAI